tara:strand:- start:245 stop:763 length:519 start_codon:yes stop_codon:yes gene_type:complete
MENLPWIIAGIITPIPIFHFWLHALLPSWRRFPAIFYALCGSIWIGVFLLFKVIDTAFTPLFTPTKIALFIGSILIGLGTLLVLWSLYSLKFKRFFMYAVLRPKSIKQKLIKKGAFHFIPHPAYNGYLIVGLGALLISGQLYIAIVFIFLLTTTPLLIWLEEAELKERLQLT